LRVSLSFFLFAFNIFGHWRSSELESCFHSVVFSTNTHLLRPLSAVYIFCLFLLFFVEIHNGGASWNKSV
jgi:hypothetical protein